MSMVRWTSPFGESLSLRHLPDRDTSMTRAVEGGTAPAAAPSNGR
jgi:hypothetical protein